MSGYITAVVITTSATSLQVDWEDITFLSSAGSSYDYVRIDQYQTGQDPGTVPAQASQGTGAKPLSPAGGTTVFGLLQPKTSYTFYLYGIASIDGSGGDLPVAIDSSDPVTTPATGAPDTAAQDLPPPICTGQAFPQTLQDTNRIVIQWTSTQGYDIFAVTIDYSESPPSGSREEDNTGGTTGSFTFSQLQPLSVHAFSVQGGQDRLSFLGGFAGHYWSAYGPLVNVQAVANTHELRKFLSDSGVSGAGGIRPLVPNLDTISLRALMGV